MWLFYLLCCGCSCMCSFIPQVKTQQGELWLQMQSPEPMLYPCFRSLLPKVPNGYPAFCYHRPHPQKQAAPGEWSPVVLRVCVSRITSAEPLCPKFPLWPHLCFCEVLSGCFWREEVEVKSLFRYCNLVTKRRVLILLVMVAHLLTQVWGLVGDALGQYSPS